MMVKGATFGVVYIVPMRIDAQVRQGLALSHVLRFGTQQAVAQVDYVLAVAI